DRPDDSTSCSTSGSAIPEFQLAKRVNACLQPIQY
ncbi:hypothetical protein A2U01_0083913, partial [Trifolium medium]|nr:hypothetical protein [Trifolium medium]